MASAPPSMSADDALAAYAIYPFDSDPAFSSTHSPEQLRKAVLNVVNPQEGFASIVAGGALADKTEHEQADIRRRSRVFFFNRLMGTALTLEQIAEYEAEQPRTLSFAELKELIEQGRVDEIPNNRQIPSGVHEAAPTASTSAMRKKPWES